jgi:hypothetical protein
MLIVLLLTQCTSLRLPTSQDPSPPVRQTYILLGFAPHSTPSVGDDASDEI